MWVRNGMFLCLNYNWFLVSFLLFFLELLERVHGGFVDYRIWKIRQVRVQKLLDVCTSALYCTTTISRQIFVLDLYFFLNHRLRMISSDFESFSRICHKMHICLESVSISVFSSKICQHICFFGLESVSILYFLSRIC